MPSPPVPRLSPDAWLIAPGPDLAAAGLNRPAGRPGIAVNQPNDHTIYRAADGRWHLWACVRLTRVGRVLCHWSAASLRQSDWTLEPDVIRADRSAGESRVDWRGEEFIQSPFVLHADGQFWMFYGGYDVGTDRDGAPTTDYNRQEKQLCLMTSPGGLTWHRRRNSEGFSRVFVGPGAVRDPCIVNLSGLWHCYYSGHHDQDRTRAGIYARTSRNLVDWSDWTLVQHDRRTDPAGGAIIHESPFVVERRGWYYLFRTHGVTPGTHVYASRNPLDFGAGPDSAALLVCSWSDVIAPERVLDGPDEYLSNILLADGWGITLRPLTWDDGGTG